MFQAADDSMLLPTNQIIELNHIEPNLLLVFIPIQDRFVAVGEKFFKIIHL